MLTRNVIALTSVLALSLAGAEKAALEVDDRYEIVMAFICLGPNGFNAPLGYWEPGYSEEKLQDATLNYHGCDRMYTIYSGFELGGLTFTKNNFEIAVCGRGSDNLNLCTKTSAKRVYCADEQVLVGWHPYDWLERCRYEAIEGAMVRKPGQMGGDVIPEGVQLVDPINAHVIIVPSNRHCSIEYTRAECIDPNAPVTDPPTTPQPTTPPPNSGGSDSTSGGGGDTTTTGGGGGTTTGGDTDITNNNSNVVNNYGKEEEEEEGCGNECIGAISSVAGVVATFLGLFVGCKWKRAKDSDDSSDGVATSGPPPQTNSSSTSIPLGGPVPDATKNKKDADKKDAPDSPATYTPIAIGVLQPDADSSDEEEEGEKKTKKKKKKKSIQVVEELAGGGSAPVDGSSVEIVSAAKKKKKKKARASTNVAAADGEDVGNKVPEEPASEELSTPIDGSSPDVTCPTKKKKKKKRASSKTALADGGVGDLSSPIDGDSPDATCPTKKKKKKKRVSTKTTLADEDGEGDEEHLKKPKRKSKKKKASSIVVADAPIIEGEETAEKIENTASKVDIDAGNDNPGNGDDGLVDVDLAEGIMSG